MDNPLRESTQLLLVISKNWDENAGTLFRFERSTVDSSWKQVDSFPVMLGKKGLGWGRGLHGGSRPGDPEKKEGDLRAPAGVFSLGTAFGEKAEHPGSYPYLQVTAGIVAVDDVNSSFYNQIVDREKIERPDWKSEEKMQHKDGLYRMGLFVNHNFPKPVPGLGSCIFLHIWRGEGKATIGCTSMEANQLSKTLSWLRPEASPLLVQLPAQEFARVKEEWKLPQPSPITQPRSATEPGFLFATLLVCCAGLLLLKRKRRL